VAWLSVLILMTALAGQIPPEAKAQGPVPPAPGPQSPSQSSSETSSKKPDAPAGSASQTKEKASSLRAAPEKKAESPAGKETGTGKKRARAAPKTAKSSRDVEVRVRTQDEMRKSRSPFLLPPGSSSDDRYGEESDWYDLPPWRKTTFFGVPARGQFFVYVVDCSGSMLDDDRLTRATIELRRSVFALQQPQKFEVIFYSNESIPMPGGPIPRTADLQAKNQLLLWLRLIEPDGGTDPRPAMKQALMLRPDAVFLLSDGEFPQGTVDEVARLNTRKIPIHCVDLAGGLAGDHLKRIAVASGGQYASRPGSLHVAPPSRTDRP
jgi:hypothetical protein